MMNPQLIKIIYISFKKKIILTLSDFLSDKKYLAFIRQEMKHQNGCV